LSLGDCPQDCISVPHLVALLRSPNTGQRRPCSSFPRTLTQLRNVLLQGRIQGRTAITRIPADAAPGWLLSRAADATPHHPAGPLCLSGNQTPHPAWRCTGCLAAAGNQHGQLHGDRLQEPVVGGTRPAPPPRPRYSPSYSV